jgi:uncharacterized cupin superfamily protein
MTNANNKLIQQAQANGFSVSVSGAHTIVSKGKKSITIFQDGTIVRNDVAAYVQANMSAKVAKQVLGLV